MFSSLRKEYKYFLNEADFITLNSLTSALLSSDSHSQNGSYTVRSLYFDDPWDSALHDKLNGVSKRKKYRLRMYNNNSSLIKLECRHRYQGFIFKESLLLTSHDATKLINGNYDFLLNRSDEKLALQFYTDFQSQNLKPVIVIDYLRHAYAFEKVRVTFDSKIQVSFNTDFFNPSDLRAMNPETIILELKYFSYFPDFLKTLLQPYVNQLRTSFSKYVWGRTYDHISRSL